MSGRYHEHRRELLVWPWKYFAAQWGRLMIYAAEQQAKERQEERERAMEHLREAHKASH